MTISNEIDRKDIAFTDAEFKICMILVEKIGRGVLAVSDPEKCEEILKDLNVVTTNKRNIDIIPAIAYLFVDVLKHVSAQESEEESAQ